MVHGFRHAYWRLILALLALIVSGCGGQATKAPTVQATTGPNQAVVNALAGTIRLLRSGSAESDLQPGDSANLQARDQVAIEGKGRAFLEFPQQLEVELVRGSRVQIDDFRAAGTNPVVVAFKQVDGHSFTRLESNQKVQLAVVTDYATTKPIADDTQFLVCHTPGVLTCVVVVNGAAQVDAQNKAVTLKAGEGTFVTPNQAPHVPFCADLNQVRDWWSKMRAMEDTSDLGSMVVAWMQRPCPTPAPGTAQIALGSATGGAATTPATAITTAAGSATSSTRPPTDTATAPATPTAGATPSATVPPATATGAPTIAPTASPTAAPTAQPTAYLPSNADMAKIDAGTYGVGNSSAPDDNHIPAHAVQLPAFWIDKYDATNAQYKVFLDATNRPAPAAWRGGTFPAGHDRFPVTGLTWDDATAFCAWAGKRLPAEAEWEVAGRGPTADPPLYPWGADPTAGGEADNLPQRETYAVGAFPFNRSAFDVYDLIGSVWQWVGEPYAPVPEGLKVLRGGRYGLLEDLAYRQPVKSNDERFTRVAGVRCAADRVAGE